MLSILLVLVPSFIISNWFWGNGTYYHEILFQPIPVYMIYFLLVAFPISIGFAELATYFGYIMPRLKQRMNNGWLAVLLPIVFLSIQHFALPLVFDSKFIMFRALMYLPLSIMLGIALNKRPTLLPYLSVLHVLLDAMTVTMLTQVV